MLVMISVEMKNPGKVISMNYKKGKLVKESRNFSLNFYNALKILLLNTFKFGLIESIYLSFESHLKSIRS